MRFFQYCICFMLLYSKRLLCFLLCIFIYVLIFVGDSRSWKRALRLHRHRHGASSRKNDANFSGPEAKIFAQSTEISRLTNDENITRLLNKLDLVRAKNVVADAGKLSIEDLVLVSAWSEDHHLEAQFLCPAIKAYNGFHNLKLKLIIYNLGGLTIAMKKEFKRNCSFAEFRQFAFFRYPPFVANILTYRWKPIIIAETLLQYPLILWMDSSINFKNDVKFLPVKEIVDRITQDDWRMKFALFGYSSHSIFAATNPGMYNFLPISEEKAKSSSMWEASHMLWIATAASKQRLLRPWVECALIDDCMAPKGAKTWCDFSEDQRNSTYAGCHRYDQSAISIIASVQSAFNDSQFVVPNAPMETDRKRFD